MAIFDFLKKNKEKDRFLKKKKIKTGKSARKDAADEVDDLAQEKESRVSVNEKKADFKEEFLILESPILTEKAAVLNKDGAYVFKVQKNANKIMIKRAIEKFYNVKVLDVNTMNMPAKKIFVRGKLGSRPGYKKAVVYLEKGGKIEI